MNEPCLATNCHTGAACSRLAGHEMPHRGIETAHGRWVSWWDEPAAPEAPPQKHTCLSCTHPDRETVGSVTFGGVESHLCKEHFSYALIAGWKPQLYSAERRPAGAEPEKQEKPPEDERLDHKRSCSAGWDLEADCTCALQERIEIQTLHELRSAWEKRAYEAEAENARLTQQLAGLRESREELVKAAQELRNEAHRFISMADVNRHGYTNIRALHNKLDAVDVALANAAKLEGE